MAFSSNTTSIPGGSHIDFSIEIRRTHALRYPHSIINNKNIGRILPTRHARNGTFPDYVSRVRMYIYLVYSYRFRLCAYSAPVAQKFYCFEPVTYALPTSFNWRERKSTKINIINLTRNNQRINIETSLYYSYT